MKNHVICNNQFAFWCPYNDVLVTVYISSCILYWNLLFQMICFDILKKKYNFQKKKEPLDV